MTEEVRPTWKRNKSAIGRTFNQELANEIIRRIASGETLKDICHDSHMPRGRAVGRWRDINTEFNEAYVKASRKAIRIAEGLPDDANYPIVPIGSRGVGRPSIRTDETVCEVIERLEDGETLAQICQDKHLPRLATIYRWANEDPAFREIFARARTIGAEVIQQVHCLEIADDGRNDYYEKTSKSGETFVALDSENIQRSKLRIEARKWIVGTINPALRDGPQVKINVTSPEIGSISIGGETAEPTTPEAAFEEYQRLVKGE